MALSYLDRRMIPIYVRRILDGKITIDQVPENLKEYVNKELEKEVSNDQN